MDCRRLDFSKCLRHVPFFFHGSDSPKGVTTTNTITKTDLPIIG